MEWNFTLPAFSKLFKALEWHIKPDTVNLLVSGKFNLSNLFSGIYSCDTIHLSCSTWPFRGYTACGYELNKTLLWACFLSMGQNPFKI